MDNASPIMGKKPEPILLSFPSAIEAVKNGMKITKKEWDNELRYGVLKEEWLIIHKEDGTEYRWLINDGDLKGKDWYILPEVKE